MRILCLSAMRKGTSTRTITALVAAVVVISSLTAVLVYTNQGSSGSPHSSSLSSTLTASTSSGLATTSSIQTPTSIASAEGTPPGLKLGLQISTNATGALSISANETNLLNKVNNVTAAADWPFPNTGSLPCGNYNQFPIEYAVLQGHYDSGNYTSASALTLYDPGDVYLCVTESFLGPYLLFAPVSDNVSYSSGQEGSFLVSANVSVTGYWTRSGTTASFHQFPPGVYTVLVEDEWGNILLLPFTVTSNTISVSGLSLCPSDCVYPAPYVSASVLINGSVPISSLTVYVNNTYDGVAFQNPSTTTIACTTGTGQTCSVELGGSGSSSGTSTTITKYYATCSVPANATSCSATYTGSVNPLTVFDYQYKGSLPSSFIPAVPGDTYMFKFVATFEDGSTATASASTIAS